MKKYLNAALHKLTVLLEFIISFVLAAGIIILLVQLILSMPNVPDLNIYPTMTNIRSFWKEEMKLNSENMWQFRLRSNLDLKDSLKQTIIRQLLHTSEILDHFSSFRDLQCRD